MASARGPIARRAVPLRVRLQALVIRPFIYLDMNQKDVYLYTQWIAEQL
jgi:hypothetical protein